jgi:hypothetical protein
MINISRQGLLLLENCLKENRPDLLFVITQKECIEVDETLGNELRDAVGDELARNGFVGDVPNKLGLELEDLIDELGRLFMKRK